jgi:hypothetical protein
VFEVSIGSLFARPGQVFLERDADHPMQGVLDAPVVAE